MGDQAPGQRWRPAAALAALIAVIATAGVLIAVSHHPALQAPVRSTLNPTSIPTPTPTAPLPPPDLSGTWTGLCTGPFTDGCWITWMQTGDDAYDGTFTLSPHDTIHISGNLNGSTIRFGDVGVMTFSGTLSGSTMSGSYTDIANGTTGSWTVTLTT
jgi:hypothetical protein